jgi:hypothetical protein
VLLLLVLVLLARLLPVQLPGLHLLWMSLQVSSFVCMCVAWCV